MKKDVIVVVVGVILISVAFCGCQSSQVKNNYGVSFESDVVNLINYTMEPRKNRAGNIDEITIQGRIENIVDKKINVKITAEFYDKNDGYINESSYKIIGLRIKPNPGYSTTFTIVYSGKNVDKVDHIRLHAEEF